MNRNRIFTGVIIAATTAMTIVACKRSSIQHPSIEGEITVNTSIAGASDGQGRSRAIADATIELKDIQFLHQNSVTTDLLALDMTDVTPVSGTRPVGATSPIKFDLAPKYDMDNGLTAYLKGYYPAGVLDAATDIVTWTPDGATDILYTELWNAGTDAAPITTGMEFLHATARLEIIMETKTGTTPAQVADTWGKVTGVTVDDIPTTLTYDYATGARTAGSTMGAAPLLGGDKYITDGATDGAIGVNGNTDVKFASMLVPVARKTLAINLTTEKKGEIKLTATLSKDFEQGKVHTVRISFGMKDKEVTIISCTIRDWDMSGPVLDQEVDSEPKWVEINGLKWATGNLVARKGFEPGGVGPSDGNGPVIIGKPTDGGLYFQFGSLIGYKGGNTASGGRGTGIPHGATTTDPMPDDKYWGQAAAYSWANDAMVWPQTYTNGATTWPQGLTDNSSYFGLGTAPYDKKGQKLSDYLTWESGGLVNQSIAVGDPCRYYLGGAWRMPTAEDWGKLFNSVYANGPVGGAWPGASEDWVYGTGTKTVMAGIPDSNSATEGIGLYANTTATNIAGAVTDPGALFFPASGSRYSGDGSFYNVGRYGYYWSGSVYSATSGFYLLFSTTDVYPQTNTNRAYGFPVRCVSEP